MLLNELMSLSASTIADSFSPTNLFTEDKSPFDTPMKPSLTSTKLSPKALSPHSYPRAVDDLDLSPIYRPLSNLSSPPKTKRSSRQRRSSLIEFLHLQDSPLSSVLKSDGGSRRSSIRASTGKIKSYREPSLRSKIRKGFQFFESDTLQSINT